MVLSLSVIIPTLSRLDGLLRQLQSLQAQTLDTFEIVVVDNAAEQSLARRLRSWNVKQPHPALYVPEPHLGLMEARHAGARAATGELLVWVRVLLRAGFGADEVRRRSLADLFPGALLKLKSDREALLDEGPGSRVPVSRA